ncbi:MAG: hypothetical protein PHE17_11375 [Thiothrix sp.]|uniref:hypothetical protein n=1 Tax=Thiothrix sp. TaxID=1032 RepID=UPI00260F4F17|nr:hypothetical protein [Thiothrix sp.]MDD5393608.1 hypothetical protein [Thiothrix sp.]
MTQPYYRIFLLSHMRAYSSTLGHIIGSHPRINGYYEMHQSYLCDADLAQQIADYSQHDSLKPNSHYQFDKLLHNDYQLNLSLPALQDAVIFIALREPEPTIKSIIKLFRKKSDDHLYAQPTGATNYYLERLQTLADFAQQHPQRYYYFDTEKVCTDTDGLLSQLQQWIGVAEPLSREYGSFAKTGVAGAGDTSPLIHTGKVLPNFQEALDDVELDATLLQQAEQAYQSSRALLLQYAKQSF